MRTNQVKQLTLGAMMLALVGVLLVIDTMSAGFLISTIPFLIPIPFVIYTQKYGFNAGATVVFAALLLGLFLAPFYQVILTCMYAIIGVAYGYGAKKGLNDKQLLIVTFGFVLIIYAVTMVLFGAVFGYNLIGEIEMMIEMVQSVLGANASLYSISTYYFMFLFAIILQALLEAFVIHMLSAIIFLNLKITPVKKVKLRDINYPWWLGVISALLFLLMRYLDNLDQINMIVSFFGTLGFIYLSYLGMLFFYKNKRFNKWAIYSIILFTLTLAMYAPIHLAIGLFTSVSGFWSKVYE